MIIVGADTDPHVRAVLDELGSQAAEAVLLNTAALDGERWSLDASGAWVQIGDVKYQLSDGQGWIRRLAQPDWRRATLAGSVGAAERNAWIELLVGMIHASDIQWLSSLSSLTRADNKLVQLAIARKCGVRTPQTSIASSPDLLPKTLGEAVVVKPLGPGDFIDNAGVGHVVWATVIERADPLLGSLAAAPFLVQESILAKAHLRVVTVQNSVFAGRLPAAGLEVDWRQHEAAHYSFEPYDLPRALSAKALNLARAFGIGYSSQDWIESVDGEYVFLDLNPAGQWLFLPEEVSQLVTREIARWLCP